MFTDNWWITNVITTCAIIFMIAYNFCVSTFRKWEKLNVPYIIPVPLFGNFLRVALGKDHPLEFYNKIYHEFAGHKYAGVCQMRTPFLVMMDPEIINDVLIKNFTSFPNHGVNIDIEVNPLANDLLNMENPQWKTMRNKLTPAFTSGKLKVMYDQIKGCGDELMKNFDEYLNKNGNEIEVKDIIAKYSTDVIGTCAFGLKLDAINDDESQFRKHGKVIFTPSLRFLIRELCALISPALLKFVRVEVFSQETTDFFQAAFKETMTYRLENNIVRNDLVLNTDLPKHEKFTESPIVANAFNVCQLKLSKNDGQINHELFMDLHYLDMVLAEVLRKYPPLVFLMRKASQKYRFPNDSLTIEKDQKIIIPVYAIHHDSKYYPEPEKFIPERFSTEERAKRPNGIYMPFGDGPQICIGKRFA